MAYRIKPDIPKPSDQLFDYLMGKVSWNDTPQSIRSWAQKSIHDAAIEIIAMKDKPSRQKALTKIPTEIRTLVEVEIMRVWKLRR